MTPTPENVSFSSGPDSIHGALALPEGGLRGPAIVLVPDVHGLSDLYRELASRFAARGIATLAIDLYSREGAPQLTDFEAVIRWIAALPDPRVLGDLQAAVDWLVKERGAAPDAVGLTGFCMGGQYALLGACSLRGLSACVSFYGMLRYSGPHTELKPRSPLEAAPDLTCPYLGIFGREDGLIPPGDVEELRQRLTAAGKTFEIRTYEGCGHAFLNDRRPDAYRPEAAAEAFDRAARFFRKHLGAVT